MKAAQPATIPARETGLGEPSAVTSGVHRRYVAKTGWVVRSWTCAEWLIGDEWLVVVREFRERSGTFYQAEIECGHHCALGLGATAHDALLEAFRDTHFEWETEFRRVVAKSVPVPLWAKAPPLDLRRRRARG